MSKDIEETMKKAEEAIESLDKMAKQSLDDAEQKIKKGIVKGALWIFVTIAVYFIWGTTWFFWVLFALNVLTLGGVVFAKVMIAKAKKKISESDNDVTDYDFDADIVEDEEIVYDEKQKVLERLLNTLEEIAEEHGELYDTDCREQMSEAVFNGFIFEKENHVMPNTFGLYGDEGNAKVKKALTTYIETMLLLAKEATPKERLEMFQDEVYTKSGESQDEFFGWVDEDDFEGLR